VSAESEVRDALVAHAALIAVVPAARISVDAVEQGLARPYIAFASQGYAADLGLDNTLHATATTIDIQCIGSDRAEACAPRCPLLDSRATAAAPDSTPSKDLKSKL
jgi:hypothetical protein